MQFRVHADSKIPVLRGRANKNELIKRPDPERRGGETSPVDTQCRVSCVPPVCICIRIRTEDAIFSSPPPSQRGMHIPSITSGAISDKRPRSPAPGEFHGPNTFRSPWICGRMLAYYGIRSEVMFIIEFDVDCSVLVFEYRMKFRVGKIF